MKRFQLMQSVNPEGLYGCVQACLPYLQQNESGRGRIITISPLIYSRCLRGKTAYAMGKSGMSALTMGLAMDFERERRTDMAITSLWPAAVGIFPSLLWTNVVADFPRPSIPLPHKAHRRTAHSCVFRPSFRTQSSPF